MIGFGRKGMAPSSARHEGELDVVGAPIAGHREFLRMWNGDGVVCLIDPSALGADPFLFGLALVDAARHGAKAWAQALGITEDEALQRILKGFDAERASPTDTPEQYRGKN